MLIFRNILQKHSIIRTKSFAQSYAKFAGALSTKLLQELRMAAPDHREDPIIMKLDTPIFKNLFNDELNSLSDLFKKYGYEIRIAGGAVRDILLDSPPKDLDFATTATPEQMKDMFTKEKIRMINMNGEKHGTITPRINDKENYEVTTLRIDVLTDGRHAEVQYTTDWLLDANRRDLTVNSMFLDLEGNVYDYFFGYDDLKKRRICFVGSPEKRIQEDYLRILRYFRFYGRIATTPNNHEDKTLKAITEHGKGLEGVSGERIWTELKKILEGNFAGEIMQKIVECKIGPYIGLPTNPNISELQLVWTRSQHLKLNAITLLTSLLRTQEEAIEVHARIKLSAFERDLMYFIVDHRDAKSDPNPLKYYQMLVVQGKTKLIREFIIEVLKYSNSDLLAEFRDWKMPKFPVDGRVLKQNGVEPGKLMGLVLDRLRVIWAQSDFTATVDELTKEIPRIVTSGDAPDSLEGLT